MNSKYKHIVWDWNGTLLDDAWLCLDVINEILYKRKAIKISTETYLEHFDFPVKDFYEKIGFDFSEEPFEVPADEYIKRYEEKRGECSLQKDAVEVVHAFQSAGMSQSILSASKLNSLEQALEHYSLREYFDNVYGLADHYANGKIDIGKSMILYSGYAASETLIIGDTVHDYEVAKNIGADCILVTGGHQNRKKLVSVGVPVFESLIDVKDYLYKSLYQ